eukprot:10199310-Heterocapsa_arctica.AAC.1
MKKRSYLNDAKKADLVEAILGMGWIDGETQVVELEVVKNMVPFIEQGLMEYGYDKDQQET